MKEGIVKFSKEYVTETGLKEWVGVELSFDQDMESAIDVLRRAETIVNEYQRPKSYIMHYDNSAPVQYGPFETVSQEDAALLEIAEMIKGMYACTELDGNDGLMTFSKLASGNRETQNVFDIMFRKLSLEKQNK